jgi:hypothetical protein
MQRFVSSGEQIRFQSTKDIVESAFCEFGASFEYDVYEIRRCDVDFVRCNANELSVFPMITVNSLG